MQIMIAASFRSLLAMLLIASATACTTSTKLIQSEISVDNSALRTMVAPQVEQIAEIKNEPNVAINSKDYKGSISRLTPLAEQGQASAQYSLGYRYYNGLGAPQNDSLALKWLASAATQGNKNAIEALRRIAVANSAKTQEIKTIKPTEQAPKIQIVDSGLSKKNKKQETATTRLPEATTDVMARTLVSGVEPSLTSNEQWIMSQSEKHFTIQLVATGSKAAMHRFISSNNLNGSAVFYKIKRKDYDWYTLILGSFESLSAAQKTVSRLSPSLRKTKPWVKPISGIQKALAAR